MEKTQREYYLNEQMKAIQRELGETDDGRDDLAEIEDRIRKAKLSKEALTKAEAELKKLRQMSPMSAESTVVRNYLDWLLSLPWGKKKPVKKDLKKAEEILDADHYGLEKVKERILEYLAVQARTTKVKGPILCLVGPPGVGKTSLGKSIAQATGRDFVRLSLGGVRDEAEIRGHRRTYIGSMPGRVIQSMKKAKSANPLFLLDEIDKLGADYRGDPSAALLEVLDPEQNATFNDHYLEVDYDLSDVLFITTANSLNMPQPLLDRMEIIRIPGYTEDEKVEIAKKYLLPKQVEANGLKAGEFSATDEAIRDLIRRYTREAGVRSLERELANLCRKSVREIEQKKKKSVKITAANLPDYAGVWKYRFGETRSRRPGRHGHGTCVDGNRRRPADDRGRVDAGPRCDDRYRKSARRDEGVHLGRKFVRAFARGAVRHQAADLPRARYPRARSGRRHAERWSVRGRGDGHGDCLGAHRHSCAQGHRDDRRGHAARPRAADRRLEGKASCGVARRREDGADPERK